LAVLAHVEGDHVDIESLAQLASVRGAERALQPLKDWHLVQEPARGRHALHAVVRHAVRAHTTFPAQRFFDHYVTLLERSADRLKLEQTHLFAAMDHAYRNSDFGAILRVERLVRRLEGAD
ncbi:MAG TPA: hypothetical protein VIM73_23420, partial [Polyangiaceae bacterium]